MKKLLASLKLIAPIYLFFIVTIFVIGIWSTYNLPFTPSFPYYEDLSSRYSRELSAFAHFDGIHYLRLIGKGYDDTGSQAFFPVYPLIIRTLTLGIFDPLYVAILFNALSLLTTLIIATSYLTRDHVRRFLLIFLTFPASFFLLANYTESFFILLIALFFHFLKDKKYFISAVVAGIASGTRLVGAFLALSLMVELFRSRKEILYSASLILISLSGLLGYMYFLYVQFGDPLMFIHVQSLFGASRSDGTIILLPQVIYRYFRIVVTATPTTILYARSCLELLTFSLSLVVLYLYRHKLSLAAIIFCLSAIILPTLSGTLSSFARYLLVALPLFVILSDSLSKRLFWIIVCLQYGILIGAVALFVQGIFIA